MSSVTPAPLQDIYYLFINQLIIILCLSLPFSSVSPLSFLFLLTFSYLSHPSSSPLPSFRGLLIHLLSTYSLINMPPLCLSLSYLYYSVEMSSSPSPISLPLFLLSASSLSVFLIFFFLNRWISGRLLTFTSEALLSTDRQFVCLKASRTQRSIFCVNVWACVSRSLLASLALAVRTSLAVLKLWSKSRAPWQAPMLGSRGACVIAISIRFKCWPITSPPQWNCS